MTYAVLSPTIEAQLHVRCLGYLPVMKDCSMESRHLGLVTAEEVKNLKEKMQLLDAYAKLDAAEQQVVAGQTLDARSALQELRARYGI